MPGRKLRPEIFLLAASTLLVLLGAELAVRLAGGGRPQPTGYAPVPTNRRAMRPTPNHWWSHGGRGALPMRLPATHRRNKT